MLINIFKKKLIIKKKNMTLQIIFYYKIYAINYDHNVFYIYILRCVPSILFLNVMLE